MKTRKDILQCIAWRREEILLDEKLFKSTVDLALAEYLTKAIARAELQISTLEWVLDQKS